MNTMLQYSPDRWGKSGLLLGLLWIFAFEINAQELSTRDSCEFYLDVLQNLTHDKLFEKAALEADNFRNHLDATGLQCPAAAVPLLTGIYRANKNEHGVFRFLGEAEIDARYAPPSPQKAALLRALAHAFEEMGDPARALSNQKLLTTVQDTLNARQRLAESRNWAGQIDSLQQLRILEGSASESVFKIGRLQAALLAIVLITLLLILALSNYRMATRWRKRLLHKDIEMDLLRANLQPSLESIQPFTTDTISRAENSPTEPVRTYFRGTEGAGQTALLIEPNRQISLYLKSLLADRFHVETALTAAEGMQTAEKLMPDLIICDAVLNGRSGMDIARQLKLSEKTSHIPVILLSERHGNEGKLDALRAGADIWFPRPFTGDELDASVQGLMEIRKERQAAFARYLHQYFTDKRPVLNDVFLQKTMSMIDSRLSDPEFMTEDLARKMQFSNQHFAKKLRWLTGKEPAQLIKEMRLEKAKVLLENRTAPPQIVGEMVGFSNVGAFAMAFKEYFGENTLLMRG